MSDGDHDADRCEDSACDDPGHGNNPGPAIEAGAHWRLEPVDAKDSPFAVPNSRLVGPGGRTIGYIFIEYPPERDNAAFLLRAVGSHADLLAFAEDFKRMVDEGVLVPNVVNNGFARLCRDVCAVIAKANGGALARRGL